MTTTKFIVPAKKKPPVDPAQLAAFGSGADPIGQVTPSPITETVNFEALDNKRRIPRFTMRLTDLEAAKLQHLAETTPNSMHEFCLQAVQKALAEKFPNTTK